ncbi:MAG: FAD:protein FMN transferase [Elusimicrobia bacterium]|nr:FAD:protein FMN transferase [Elusimicrobiota bacterium]
MPNFPYKLRIRTLLLITFLGLGGCSSGKLQKYQDAQVLMGTHVSITVFCNGAPKAARAMKAAFARISELETLMSKQREDSDLARLNAAPTGKTKVAPETFAVIRKAVDFGKITHGAFDVTVEPLLTLWRKAEAKNSLPTPDAMKRALSLTGFDHIILYPESSQVGFAKAGMKIDLGGIAKGYIVGEAVAALKAQGIKQALVAAGGDMFALGGNPARTSGPNSVPEARHAPQGLQSSLFSEQGLRSGAERGGWLIGIRNPLKPEENLRYIEVSDKAVATSGHYMRFYTVRGKRYSHIVDPRTGYPARNNVVSVTIVGPEGTAADALTKSAIVLGPEKGLAIIQSQPGFDALVITWDKSKLEYFQTAGFSKYLRTP